MNAKTTLFLLLLVAGGGAAFLFGPTWATTFGLAPESGDAAGAGTANVLGFELTPARLTRIDVRTDAHTVSLKRSGDDWTLPGEWPTRKPEVDALVSRLTGLRSRFLPLPLGDDLGKYGLDKPTATVTLQAGEKQYHLAFGEPGSGGASRFARPTYVRLDDKPEVLRLAPGLVADLDKPVDYYQQRQLFRGEQAAKSPGSPDKVERLSARKVEAAEHKAESKPFVLARDGDRWTLQAPFRDHVDPERLNTLLTAVPELWAEKFVADPKKDLAEYGLKEPEQTLSVTLPGGDVRALLIGKASPTRIKRKTTQPGPPGTGLPPQVTEIEEPCRYAKLQNNEQVFEINTARLKDIFVPAAELRDPRLARFEVGGVQRVEVKQDHGDLVLVKDGSKWKIEKPLAADAEAAKVTELIDKLAFLEARDKDVIDSADPKPYGLDRPAATVTLTVEEATGSGAAAKKTTTTTFRLGKEVEKGRLYVGVAGWDRVNAVEDSVLKLVQRPALAYRGRRVLDFPDTAVDALTVQRGGEQITLKQVEGSWRLTAPTQAQADGSKVSQLVRSLADLEAVEYVSEAPRPEELDGTYGLAKPGLAVTVALKEARPPVKLLVGQQRPGKDEYFAKLESAPAVFVVKKPVHDALDQSSLAYRPLDLWQVAPADVAMVRVQKEGHEEYTLGRDGSNWKIGGPFEATPVVALTEPMLRELAVVRAERCEAHTAKDLAGFGLDKPYLRVTLATTPAKADGEKNDNPAPVEKPVEKVLLVGKPTGPDAHSRFAKLGSGEAVYVVSDKLVAAVDKDALDLLERRLLDLGGAAIDSVKVSGGEAPLTLQKQGDRWQVTQSPAPPFGADPEAAAATVAVWTNLRAQRFAAHGPKADLAKFGLDKPALTVKVTARPAAAGDPKAGPVEHTLVLGKPVEGNAGERYARLDNGPGVAVLSNAAVTDLMRTYLDYVDRTVLKLGPETARSLSRKGGEELELMKKDDGWHLNKPADMKADDKTLENLLGQLATLRAVKVAAYPAKDIKPFGLDTPSATWTLKVLGTDGKPVEHTLKLGKPVDGPSGDRFAQADKSDTVVVLAAPLVGRLLDGALAFRNRNLAQFPDADRIALERGPRKALFAKVDGTWKLTEPLDAPAEQAELEDFLNAAARLRADALVADKPGDLKPYGLDKPEARWRFLAGDKEVLNLQVGSRTPDGRAHAKLAGDNLVFLLDPALTAKVLGEFRTRTVWPTPPDVSQAEGIRFTSLKNPFILEKVDNAWHVAGKPEVKVNAQAVSDTLAAFADLKAQRYVVDRDADLKLYGLEPPQLILEVLTPAGKKVLHIGRPEGESKRVYAQAPEKAKGEVIVLSETDAAKLVRDLGAFTQGADKVGAQP